MIIRVKVEDLKFPIIVPLPLVVLEDFLDSLARIGKWGLRFFRKNFNFSSINCPVNFDVSYEEILESGASFFRELRRSGRFTLVEVKDEGVHITIKLY